MGLRRLLDRLNGHRESDLTAEVREEEALAQARWWVEADRYAAATYGPDSVERRLLAPPLWWGGGGWFSGGESGWGKERCPQVELMDEPLRVERQRYAGELRLSPG